MGTRTHRRQETRREIKREKQEEREQDGPRRARAGNPRKRQRKRQGGRREWHRVGKVPPWSEDKVSFSKTRSQLSMWIRRPWFEEEKAQARRQPSAMRSSQRTPERPSQGGRGQGWGQRCRDGGGAGSKVSWRRGRNGPRAVLKLYLLSSGGPQEGKQRQAERAGRAGPSAGHKQTQASWCQPEAGLPITHLPGLRRKDLWKKRRERREKERKVRACVLRKRLHPVSQLWME